MLLFILIKNQLVLLGVNAEVSAGVIIDRQVEGTVVRTGYIVAMIGR